MTRPLPRFGAFVSFLARAGFSQSAAGPAAKRSAATVVLSPFEVTAGNDVGHQAANPAAGSPQPPRSCPGCSFFSGSATACACARRSGHSLSSSSSPKIWVGRVGACGNKDAATPQLDRLARGFIAPAPSRSARPRGTFFSDQWPAHTGMFAVAYKMEPFAAPRRTISSKLQGH